MIEPSWSDVEAAVRGIDPAEIAGARWYGAKGRPIEEITPVEAFDLGAGAVLAVVDVAAAGGPAGRYLLPLRRESGGLRQAVQGDGTWRALGLAVAEGRTVPSLRRPVSPSGVRGPVSAALVCRPAAALRDLAPGGADEVASLSERPLGLDQSNTSVVLGERLLLKVYRRLETGLNPDLELNAYLAEEVSFGAVPRLAGYVEMIASGGASTVAIVQEFVVDGADAYESLAEQLAAWILAPGEVTVEFATEVAAELGSLTAALHAALGTTSGVPEFSPREATRAELRAWRRAADRQLQRAIDVVRGPDGEALRAMAPAIAEQLTVLEALPTVPLVTRVHADFHLGQVMSTPDGFRIIDFEGEPTRPLEERRAHNSPLRDVASMLRSIDHAGRSARRRAEERRGGPVESPGLPIDAWARPGARAFRRCVPPRVARAGGAVRGGRGPAAGVRVREGDLRVHLCGDLPPGVDVGAARRHAWAHRPGREHSAVTRDYRVEVPVAAASPVTAELRAAILAWYDKRARALPFRASRDPWAILVSEAMAQQTQISRVVEKWGPFMAAFPTVQTLAAATPADVLRAWQGLGYNRRALNLWRAAGAIVAEHGGRVPEEVADLERLPGVGPYTARAVAAIAFGRPVGAVDTNVRRVIGRVAGGGDGVPATALQSIADAAVPRDRPADWTHAVMDVGATFCRPRRPDCAACPARTWCRYAAAPPEIAAKRARSRQQPFETTSRWLRGRILEQLRAAGDGAWTTIADPLGSHTGKAIHEALGALARDGLVELAPAAPGTARLPLA